MTGNVIGFKGFKIVWPDDGVRLNPERNMNDCTRFHANPSNMSIKLKCRPHGGARGQSRDHKGHFWMSVQAFQKELGLCKAIQKQNAIVQLQFFWQHDAISFSVLNHVFCKVENLAPSLLVNKGVKDAPFIPSHNTNTCYRLTCLPGECSKQVFGTFPSLLLALSQHVAGIKFRISK